MARVLFPRAAPPIRLSDLIEEGQTHLPERLRDALAGKRHVLSMVEAILPTPEGSIRQKPASGITPTPKPSREGVL